MRKETFDVFCPDCNMLVEAKTIKEATGDFQSEALNPEDVVDARYDAEHYTICLCPRCKHPFFFKESLQGVPAEYETVVDSVMLYPTESKISTEFFPDAIENAYIQALRSYKTSLFDPCVLMCRKCLEGLCKILNVSGSNLYKRLENLKEAKQIDDRLLKWGHQIRVIGNEAAHDIDTPVSKKDAQDILEFTEAILIYVFSLTRRYESLIKRRQESNN
ncbi:MAG: DUF4145 domain-containing protein [Desulfotalea sp.]